MNRVRDLSRNPLRRLSAALCLLLCAGYAAGEPRPVQSADAWERDPTPLIRNFENMYQPCVLEFPGEEYPYRMWFFGWAESDTNTKYPGCDAIFHARSKDLLKWEIHAGGQDWDTAMDPSKWIPVIVPDAKFYDEWHNGDPSVVFRDGTYYMAFSSTSKDFGSARRKGHPNNMLLCVMGATSKDGITWIKTEQPLLIESPEAQDPASDGGWIGDFHRPSLMWEDGRWRLWFDYWYTGHGLCMGYAENTGGFTEAGGFKPAHDLTKPLIVNWPNPEVIRVGDTYHAFADPGGYPGQFEGPGAGWRSRQLCEAVSEDGLTWEIAGFIAPDPDAAACHVPQALLTRRDGRDWLYLFYATQRGGTELNGNYDYRYDRIRAMRRRVE